MARACTLWPTIQETFPTRDFPRAGSRRASGSLAPLARSFQGRHQHRRVLSFLVPVFDAACNLFGQKPVNKTSIDLPRDEFGVMEEAAEKGNVGLDPAHFIFVEGSSQALDRLRATASPDD